MTGFTRILCPTDFSEPARDALAWAAEFARSFGGKIDIVHVCALHEDGPVEAEAEMETAVPAEYDDVVLSKRIVRALSADLGILNEARSGNADLIVMGTHGRSRMKHVLLGSVAERVVQLSHCPVLTVRPSGHTFERP